MKSLQFPETIYVRKEYEGDEKYFITFEDKQDLDHEDTVAIYNFARVVKVKKEVVLEIKKEGK